MASAKFVVYEDNSGEWRWRMVSTANGQTLCDGSEGFSSKDSAMDNIGRVKEYAADAEVEDEE